MIYGYPQPGKAKSTEILVAFAQGAGGYIADAFKGLRPGPAAFYGTIGIEPLVRQAQRRALDGGDAWYYLDNSYFDAGRGRYFRASRNALQRASSRSDHKRLAELGIRIQPWRMTGRSILVVEQSDYFMREVAWYWRDSAAAWREAVMTKLSGLTDRPIRVRPWLRDKAKASSSLAEDLAGAWAVVTHSSAAAVEAILAGVPVFLTVMQEDECAAWPMADVGLDRIERPRHPDGREDWAARLAASQWTLNEMRAGMAWRELQDQREELQT